MSATPRREFVERAREALVIAEQEDYEAGYYLTPSVEEQIKRVSIALQQTADETRAYYEGEMKEFETLKELYKERCDNANLAWKKAEEWKGLSEKLFAKIGELEETITRLEAKAKKEMGE